jgi:hypothetical protein
MGSGGAVPATGLWCLAVWVRRREEVCNRRSGVFLQRECLYLVYKIAERLSGALKRSFWYLVTSQQRNALRMA